MSARRGRRGLIVGAALLLSAAGAWWWLAPQTTARQQPAPVARPAAAAPPQPVVVGRVTQVEDALQLQASGTGQALRAVALQPAVAGEVSAVGFRAGQRVSAGQVLLRLADRQQQLAVQAAQNQRDAARSLLARYEATGNSGAVPPSIVDDARQALRQAEIALAQAQEALADRVLRAPFAGVVGLATVQPGERITADTVVTTLDDRRTLRVVFELPEAALGRLAAHQVLSVQTPAHPDRRFEGRIAQLDSRVDPVTRLLRIEALVPNADDLLRPGQSFQVRLELPGASRTAVPELALQWDREGAYVWVVREGLSVRVPVLPLRRVQQQVLLDGALQPGETVVLEGVERLRPGRQVQVLGALSGNDDGNDSARNGNNTRSGTGGSAGRDSGTAAAVPKP